MSVFLQPIYTQTVGAGGASSIVFNNIPQGFADLKLVVSARDTYSAVNSEMYVQFNSDSSTSYSFTRLNGNGSTTFTQKFAGPLYPIIITVNNAATSTANTFSNMEMSIVNYSSGNFKSISAEYVTETNAAGTESGMLSGLYRKATPITSLIVYPTVSFVQNSTFTLYGVVSKPDTLTPTAPTIGAVTDQGGFASVAFTPASNDQSISYAVTGSDNVTTYGVGSPIITPVTIGSSTTFNAKAVNSLGSTASATSGAITSYNNFASIATVSAPSGSIGGVTFNSIPQNYKHLQIRMHARSINTAGSYATIYTGFNNDTFAANNYWNHRIIGDGSSAALDGQTGQQVNVLTIPWNSVTSGTFATVILDIYNYTDTTKNKVVKYLTAWDGSTVGRMVMGSAVWMNQQPLTSIYLTPDGGWAQYSHVALYGMS